MNTTTMSEESTSTQLAKLLYTAKAHTTGGREGGASRTSDGRLDVKLSFPGAPGNGTNPEQLNQTQRTLAQDPIFIRIVVGSTGLGLALMLGSLAAVKFSDANRLQFEWNWFIPAWMAVAVFGNWRFWKTVWQVQNDPTPKAKKRLTVHSVLLVALAVGAFLYPLRFIEQSHRLEVARGLATAVVFLGTAGTIIYQFGRGFAEDDGTERPRDQRAAGQ